MCVELTKHYIKRFRKRIARTDRFELFAEEALQNGKVLSEAKSSRYVKKLKYKEIVNGSTAILYKGCVHWFRGNVAITLYPLPQKMHHKI